MYKRKIIFFTMVVMLILFLSNSSFGWKKNIKIDGQKDAFLTPHQEDIVGKAQSVKLGKGIYLIKNKKGGIWYDIGRKVKPVPTVFVYSYDKEKVINLVTGSWLIGTLNRQGDIFIVEVKENNKSIYFFILDTYTIDNSGTITIEITKLSN